MDGRIRFAFSAPEEQLAYYADIARVMAERWPVTPARAVEAINEAGRRIDSYGPHADLLFHEEPWYWADIYYHGLVCGDPGYTPGTHWRYQPDRPGE